MLTTLAGKVAPLGWHLQVLAPSTRLLALAPALSALPGRLVIDHLGLIGPEEGVDGETFRLVRRLLDAGRTWVKLSGTYMESRSGGPLYADRDPVARALLRAAPQRMVWGSDWPHTTAAPGSVDDALLVDRLRSWCDDDDALMDTVLVDNPAALYGFDRTDAGLPRIHPPDSDDVSAPPA